MSEANGSAADVVDVTVPAGLHGVRCDRALAMLSGQSRTVVASAVAARRVSLDNVVVVKPSTPLVAGQRLVAELPGSDDGSVAADDSVVVEVAAESTDYVVINKRAGQVVHPGAGQRTGTLVAGLLARYPELERLRGDGPCEPGRPGIVHRLDKGTSGLLVVARTPRGYHALRDELARRGVERVYLGLVEGHLPESSGVIEAPIGRSTSTPTKMAIRADGRPARTRYDVTARLVEPRTTLLRLRLETGRTHQIRVHAASIGHPVVNDLRYGHRRDHRLAEGRLFLHATRIGFHDPSSGEWITVDAALPDDLAAIVATPVTGD